MVLSIGIRLGSVEAAPLKETKPLGRINVDVEEGDAQPNVSKVIVGDIEKTLKALIDKLKSFPPKEPDTRFLKEINGDKTPDL